MDIQTKEHRKLVRDRIPEIIEQAGGIAETEVIVDDQEYHQAVLGKLVEEAAEVASADDEHLLEELGDLQTLVDTVLKMKNLSREQLEKQQQEKDQERGVFDQRIFLISTRSNNG